LRGTPCVLALAEEVIEKASFCAPNLLQLLTAVTGTLTRPSTEDLTVNFREELTAFPLFLGVGRPPREKTADL